jgi:hypothetical protein
MVSPEALLSNVATAGTEAAGHLAAVFLGVEQVTTRPSA